jgi:hypothetical protein
VQDEQVQDEHAQDEHGGVDGEKFVQYVTVKRDECDLQ